jgi:hypothetical protein
MEKHGKRKKELKMSWNQFLKKMEKGEIKE